MAGLSSPESVPAAELEIDGRGDGVARQCSQPNSKVAMGLVDYFPNLRRLREDVAPTPAQRLYRLRLWTMLRLGTLRTDSPTIGLAKCDGIHAAGAVDGA